MTLNMTSEPGQSIQDVHQNKVFYSPNHVIRTEGGVVPHFSRVGTLGPKWTRKSWNRNQLHGGTGSSIGIGSSMWKDIFGVITNITTGKCVVSLYFQFYAWLFWLISLRSIAKLGFIFEIDRAKSIKKAIPSLELVLTVPIKWVGVGTGVKKGLKSGSGVGITLHAVFFIRDVGFFQVVSSLNFLGISTSLIP